MLEVFTRERGRCLGLIRGGRSPRNAAKLQPGNGLDVSWRARLDEHLGNFTVEPVDVRAAGLMETQLGLNAVQTLCTHVRLLPERDPHPELHEALGEALDGILEARDPATAALVGGALTVRFELMLLDALGFGLDLGACALTGASEDLAFVSPRTGRAASRAAAAPWRDKLLPLPDFLTDRQSAPLTAEAVAEGFRLTGHFLHVHVWGPRGLTPPMTRDSLMTLLS